MDYEVTIETVRQHGRDSAERARTIASLLASVRLDMADSALPGGMAASVSRTVQDHFDTAARTLRDGLDSYADGIIQSARNYADQEERAATAITSFFGR